MYVFHSTFIRLHFLGVHSWVEFAQDGSNRICAKTQVRAYIMSNALGVLEINMFSLFGS